MGDYDSFEWTPFNPPTLTPAEYEEGLRKVLNDFVNEVITHRMDAHTSSRCIAEPIGCGREITEDEMLSWDRLSQREYQLSGWCRDCQDKVFKEEPE